MTYDSFDIKGARGLEAMVQTHLASGAPCLELYVQFSSPNDAFAASTSTVVREKYTTPTQHSVSGWQNTEAPVRRDDVLPTTSIGEGTSYFAADGGSDYESDMDPPREPGPDSAEVALFSKPEPVPIEPERGSDEEEEDPRFRAYSPPAHMHNVDLSADDTLEFPNLPHRRRYHASSSFDSGELEVGKEFSNKDSFLGALKQHSIMNGVNYNVPRVRYTPSYRKAWIAKQKALEKLHSGWEASIMKRGSGVKC
ncbi:hypothetical protein J1N35_040770 [Gossypium stocksii]|uniref:Uncharacterized protein n=1 Tax=Gossypium stocksii TaxID=47602 RepID=A0A9D3ZIN2_9ROSI|nr:hypothetical protein J1N35_040770 [Gossypium stocksii]